MEREIGHETLQPTVFFLDPTQLSDLGDGEFALMLLSPARALLPHPHLADDLRHGCTTSSLARCEGDLRFRVSPFHPLVPFRSEVGNVLKKLASKMGHETKSRTAPSGARPNQRK